MRKAKQKFDYVFDNVRLLGFICFEIFKKTATKLILFLSMRIPNTGVDLGKYVISFWTFKQWSEPVYIVYAFERLGKAFDDLGRFLLMFIASNTERSGASLR